MLPSRSGISICQTVRGWDIVQPVILLVSALRDEVAVVTGRIDVVVRNVWAQGAPDKRSSARN
jgi:DNA-binding response OmpR family regulator